MLKYDSGQPIQMPKENMQHNIVNVNIGELKIAHGETIMRATLGSCVAIAMVWREKQQCALAHCFLPSGADKSPLSGRYVDQAIPNMINLIGLTKESFSKVEVFLVGGANMMDQLHQKNSYFIGEKNSQLALTTLQALGLRVSATAVVGSLAQQIQVECSTGQVSVKQLNEGSSGSESKRPTLTVFNFFIRSA